MAKGPEKLLRFIELEEFSSQRDRLGISNDDLLRLQLAICADPDAGDVIKGTGGYRKIRFARPGTGRGKSGSYRVIYLCVRQSGIVFLGTVYGKSEKGDISAADARIMSVSAARLKDQIRRGFIR